ncbi:hypothetical protein EXIGLDRAFT_716273 [Exidia glandulosa HHB12029]|uniref:uS12 prolyl 3,4-dihydroxylase n=1 Tax=Exidia glandulosa HHB12029 TaxID=1314781 RepID=A0A165QZT8_EXIGL|nr:hypothetical protein EXIGLDRAFT_716273 [Exidia glandulosa HHB12029]
MAPPRARPETPGDDAPFAKRQKTVAERDVRADFYAGLLDQKNTASLRDAYASSEPFKHALVKKLFDDALLRTASEEIIRELHFTEKETDIYKVHQTGDLASLSYLDADQLKLLPSLLALRNALYSPEFRAFVRTVTGCGPLSGKTQDMSVNSYRKGCHLLNHDDVIGTRRVSYILYMPLPYGEQWKAEWGGALELYPMLDDAKAREKGLLPEPDVVPSKVLPPAWNQFVFFEIQPGKSFHSVEEVVVDVADDGRQRLSISGWFHKPQIGEEGYADEADAVDRLKSSLEQLSDPPSEPMLEYPEWEIAGELSEQESAFLANFLNAAYLSPANLPAIADRFARDSELQLQDFLREELAARLEVGLRQGDIQANGKIPSHGSGMSDMWRLQGPPHKRRFCVLATGRGEPHEDTTAPQLDNVNATELLSILQNVLLPSKAFRTWLFCVSKLVPMKFHASARRFRPGLDYTLATSTDDDARLDVVLDLTPRSAAEVEATNGKGKGKAREDERGGWESGEWGGWVCYMAPHDGDEDPAVYRSGGSSKKGKANGSNGAANGNGEDAQDGEDADPDEDVEMEEEDDSGTLLTVQPGFNRLLLVLRDASVMHFVKYVSAAAEGSRWDVCGEWEVGMVDDDDEDVEDADEEEA